MDHSIRIPWGNRVSDRIGHHASEMLIGAILVVVAIGFYPLPGLLSLTAPFALFGLVLTCWILMRQHDRRLCEHCVLSMPLNPSEQATKLKRRFWMAHTGSEPRFLVPYLIVLISSNFATSTTIGRIGWALIQLTMIYLIMSNTTHRRLQPWCPWCSQGGGGDDVLETPPVLPQDDRQLI
jgi:hypothetical protein